MSRCGCSLWVQEHGIAWKRCSYGSATRSVVLVAAVFAAAKGGWAVRTTADGRGAHRQHKLSGFSSQQAAKLAADAWLDRQCAKRAGR